MSRGWEAVIAPVPAPGAARALARFRGLRRERVLGVVVPVADRPLARLLGLAHLDRDRAGTGLLLARCSAIHTFGMRFELDIVFLDRDGVPVRIESEVGSRRLLAERGAAAVLELPSGGAAPSPGVVGSVHP